jgi:hypothetical protein
MADAKVLINGKEYPFPTEFTLGEEAEVERITGQGYDMSIPGALGLLAIAFIAVRRVDPTVRLEDIQALKPGELTLDAEDDVDVPPPFAAGPNESGGTSNNSSDTASAAAPAPTPALTGT